MTNLKRAVGQCKDVQELRELRRAVVERIGVLEKREYQKRVDEAWERIKGIPLGTVLHVCCTGTFFGGPFQRGDSFKVTYIQPKAKRIWIEHQGKVNGLYLPAVQVERYDLRTEPPANPMDSEQRASVERMAGRIAESLAS